MYPFGVQFYDNLPGCDVSLVDFETMAIERLKLLRIFEKHAAMSHQKYSDKWREAVRNDIKSEANKEINCYNLRDLYVSIAEMGLFPPQQPEPVFETFLIV